MTMPFVELCFGGKFILRFIRNEDGTYGHWDIDAILELQPMIDLAFEEKNDDKT